MSNCHAWSSPSGYKHCDLLEKQTELPIAKISQISQSLSIYIYVAKAENIKSPLLLGFISKKHHHYCCSSQIVRWTENMTKPPSLEQGNIIESSAENHPAAELNHGMLFVCVSFEMK